MRRNSVLWFVALVGLALLLATCTERRTPKSPRSLDDGSAQPAKSEPPPPKPKHGSHDHAHGGHPHKRDAHHHHAHPHPHVEGADGHHHPY